MCILSEKRVHDNKCYNIVKDNQLIRCPCKEVVGYWDIIGEAEIVTFQNVREVLVRPHVSYTQHCVLNKREDRTVIFGEMIEEGECSTAVPFDVTKKLIHPLAEADIETQTLISEEASIIRVAAIASGNFVSLNENRVLNFFEDAIVRSLKENDTKSLHSISSVSDENLQQEPTSASILDVPRNDRFKKHGLSEFLTSRDSVKNETNFADFNLDMDLCID